MNITVLLHVNSFLCYKYVEIYIIQSTFHLLPKYININIRYFDVVQYKCIQYIIMYNVMTDKHIFRLYLVKIPTSTVI